MTPQNRLKRFLRWLGKPHANNNQHGLSAVTPDDSCAGRLAEDGYCRALRRSQTDGAVIYAAAHSHKSSDSQDGLSKPHDRNGRVKRTMSLQHRQNKLSPHLSHREDVTVTCGADCSCECHSHETDQSYLTLCRCYMSGYESYRKAVYGGRGYTKRAANGHPAGHNLQENKRKSMPDSKKFFGSADTLNSANSCDTIKASSDCASSPRTGSTGGHRSRQSTSPFCLQQLNFATTGFRDRELTLTDELTSSLTSTPADASHPPGKSSNWSFPRSPLYKSHQVCY